MSSEDDYMRLDVPYDHVVIEMIDGPFDGMQQRFLTGISGRPPVELTFTVSGMEPHAHVPVSETVARYRRRTDDGAVTFYMWINKG